MLNEWWVDSIIYTLTEQALQKMQLAMQETREAHKSDMQNYTQILETYKTMMNALRLRIVTLEQRLRLQGKL